MSFREAIRSIRQRLRAWRRYRDRRHIVGKGNRIQVRDSVRISLRFDIEGNNNDFDIGAGCYFNGLTIKIRGNNHRVRIAEGCRFNGESILWMEDSDCVLNIGQNSTFEGVHIAVVEPGSRVDIGSDCMFANDIDVRTSDSHSILVAQTGERCNPAQNVQIHDHVWVGAHCRILKGAVIPAHSIVGTGSIVTVAFTETNTIIAGVPARIVKQGIDWCRQRLAKRPTP
jgi:acetyltransferase-like isoleucine patch superfamily enzyme